MQKVMLILMLIGLATLGNAQKKEKDAGVLQSSHELKANLFNAIVYKAVDVNYEYVLNENSSFGLGIFFKVDKAEVDENGFFSIEVDNNRSNALTPYYRRYFSRGYSNGFFMEGFGMLNSGETVTIDYIYDEPQEMESVPNYTELKEFDTYTNFALGISFGAKFIKTKGFLMEVYSGLGIGISGGANEVVTRGGLSLGYRF